MVILFNTDDTKRARDFVASPELKEMMAKAGVMDKPTFYFLESAQVPKVMHGLDRTARAARYR